MNGVDKCWMEKKSVGWSRRVLAGVEEWEME